jgi:hypothetical protein
MSTNIIQIKRQNRHIYLNLQNMQGRVHIHITAKKQFTWLGFEVFHSNSRTIVANLSSFSVFQKIFKREA